MLHRRFRCVDDRCRRRAAVRFLNGDGGEGFPGPGDAGEGVDEEQQRHDDAAGLHSKPSQAVASQNFRHVESSR